MDNTTIVDVLIENIKTDQELLSKSEEKIEKAKEDKRAVVDRLKDYRKDLSVLLKYADNSQRKKIDELGFDLSESNRSINSVASLAFDILLNSEGTSLTNEEWYEKYVKSLKKKENAVNYTEFNIKCRSLFNTQRVLRKKGKDSKSTRDDLISLNGRANINLNKN